MKIINLEYCGMPGNGPTVREAKQDAARKLSALVDDIWSGPTVWRLKNHVAVVSRGAAEWRYQILWPDDGHTSEACGYDSRETAMERAFVHIMQVAWSHGENDSDFVKSSGFRWVTESTKRELLGYFAWQRRYAEGKRQGLNDAAAHDYASSHA